MGTGAVVGIVAGVLLLAAGVLLVLRVPVAERRARIALVGAAVGLRRARLTHAALVRRAELGVRRAERQHSAQVAELDRRIVALEDPRGPRIATVGPVTLHALRVVTPAGEAPLDGAEASVDTAGALSERKRTTFTRLAVGGAAFGAVGAILALGFPKRTKVDTRELYLLIEAGAASCVVQVDPDEGPRVRAFANQLNAAAAAVGARRSAIAAELAAARTELAAVREDHTALDAAREALGAARVDAAALARTAAAEARLAAARHLLAGLRG